MRYYFNFIDGITTLDQDGCEFADLAGAKAEAVKACADLFRGPFSQEFSTESRGNSGSRNKSA